ncbi:MAG: SIMPL domain-containing protein [Chloroflexi bacterium]|nr:SIMPL domain-containing protein [Chloroflexota bacterium]
MKTPILKRIPRSLRAVRSGLVVAALAAFVLVAAACADGTGGGGTTGGINTAQLESLARSLGLSPSVLGGNTGIHVTGAGTASAKPDIAVLSLSVEGQGRTVAEANAIAADAMAAILSALRGAGVDDDDMKTQGFSIQPEYAFNREDGTRTLTGYRVSNSLVVTLRDIDAVGSIIDGAAAAGGDATRINSIGFRVEDGVALEEEARRLALEDAVAKADLFAEATGVSRGKLVFITESSFPQFARAEAAFSTGASISGAPAPTEILSGDFDVRVNVQAVFAID